MNLGNRLLYQGTIDQANEYQSILQQVVDEKELGRSTSFIVAQSISHQGDWYVSFENEKIRVLLNQLPTIETQEN
ncbi:MAG: hypothetical protein OXC92_02315 [Flavobacteriaceae bacterium]|nr:hypothetical protein [Flavobacteriaceae bacterium]MCY4215801.1 hypothetical protein [Flavobacteriaceae bacterium]MCY4266801.1 hypothetical protein [Flavobacteriaceae bacterium]